MSENLLLKIIVSRSHISVVEIGIIFVYYSNYTYLLLSSAYITSLRLIGYSSSEIKRNC